jgi:ankyrin repeat protein
MTTTTTEDNDTEAFLKSIGHNANAETGYINTQVQSAVKSNNITALKACILMSENISSFSLNNEDEDGVTGLIEACIAGNTEMVEMLLEAGCPAQPEAGSFRHSPLRGATVCGQSHLIPILLKAGADPNALSEGYRTPLMGACFLRSGVDESKSIECVKELLKDPRTDPMITNSYGESALDLAKVRGYTKSIELIEKALVGWVTNDGF